MSPEVVRLLREAWVRSSLHLESEVVRSGTVLLALLQDEQLRGRALDSCPVLAHVSRDRLVKDLADLIAGSAEGAVPAHRKAPPEEEGETIEVSRAPSPARRVVEGASTDSALRLYTLDLVTLAREERIDPVLEREREIRQVIDILTRRRQNNPILVGDAGVGKTAIAEGLALRIVSGDLPEALREISLRTLDLGLLQAGAGVKGEFERRLKNVVAEVRDAPRPVILFIDEAHTLIGAGGPEGLGDAANLLKPALAAGELRTIAATTWSEYKRYFERDPALARRFQPVKVDEPSEAEAIEMVLGAVPALESHHEVRILEEAVRDAVRMSQRYLPERRLPAKAISVLDTACSRVALARDLLPQPLAEVVQNLERLGSRRSTLLREGRRGEIEDEGLDERIAELAAERSRLEARLETERALVRAAQQRLVLVEDEGRNATDDDELQRRLRDCREFQAGRPLVPVAVDGSVVAEVLSAWTGIPAGSMESDDVETVLGLRKALGRRIVGQPMAMEAISRRIVTSRAGLEDPGRPLGTFLLAGPPGVGKTATAAALADAMFGGARSLVTLNMSEYQEAHSVATLRGSPPGYVGYGRGGLLTEAVRRRPYCIVLLDEVEKAHRDVLEMFYPVFDRGVLDDAEGVRVDFRHTVVLLTTGVGSDVLLEEPEGSSGQPGLEDLRDLLRPVLGGRFPGGLVGRLEVVPYLPLGGAEIRRIVEMRLEEVRERIRRRHGAELTFERQLVEVLTDRCGRAEDGARRIDRMFHEALLPELSVRILGRMAQGRGFSSIHVTVDALGSFV